MMAAPRSQSFLDTREPNDRPDGRSKPIRLSSCTKAFDVPMGNIQREADRGVEVLLRVE